MHQPAISTHHTPVFVCNLPSEVIYLITADKSVQMSTYHSSAVLAAAVVYTTRISYGNSSVLFFFSASYSVKTQVKTRLVARASNRLFDEFWCKGVPVVALWSKNVQPPPKPKFSQMRFFAKNDPFPAVTAPQKLYTKQETPELRSQW